MFEQIFDKVLKNISQKVDGDFPLRYVNRILRNCRECSLTFAIFRAVSLEAHNFRYIEKDGSQSICCWSIDMPQALLEIGITLTTRPGEGRSIADSIDALSAGHVLRAEVVIPTTLVLSSVFSYILVTGCNISRTAPLRTWIDKHVRGALQVLAGGHCVMERVVIHRVDEVRVHDFQHPFHI